jgi:GT2 family glycosyltransferase
VTIDRSISVVIPNYNGCQLLAAHLPEVYHALRSSQITDFEVIVADDASTDGSVPFLKEQYPEIILVENAQNQGFAGNINTGIARASKFLVLLLNSDVSLTAGYFIPQLPYFNRADTFGVMAQIRDQKGDTIQDAAKYPSYHFGSITCSKNYTQADEHEHLSFFLSGANALVRRDILQQLGGFDTIFNPYYFEDADLGLRAWRLGYQLYYAPKAVCLHPISTTISQQPSQKVRLIAQRNKIVLHLIHLNGVERSWYICLQLFKLVLRLFRADLTFYRAWKAAFALRPEIEVSRKRLQHAGVLTGSLLSLRQVTKRFKQHIDDASVQIF